MKVYQGTAIALWLGMAISFQLAWGQATTATVSGAVTDSSGAMIPEAVIRILNVETGSSRSLKTDASGRYTAPDLPIGSYEISVEMTGFQKSVRQGIVLTVGRNAVVNLALQVGEVSQSVVVEGEAPLIESTSSTISAVVEEKKIRELPLNGRDFTELALLQPGVVFIPQSVATNSATKGFGARIAAGGARPFQNNYRLDGTDINDSGGTTPGSVAGYMLGVETVQEYSVTTNNYSAEFGRTPGVLLNAVTKSGTNNLHGSVYEFLRNSKMDARNFFDQGAPPAFKRNQFGFTIGGPVRKDRLFFFGGYEGLRERLGITVTGATPNAAIRQGTVSAIIKPVLDSYPLPNGRDLGGGIGEHNVVASQPTNEDNWVAKVDYHLSSSTSMFVRYNGDKADQNAPYPLGVFAQVTGSTKHYAALGVQKIFSPTLLNDFRYSYNRSTISQDDSTIGAFDAKRIVFVPGERAGTVNAGSGISTLGPSSTNPKNFANNTFQWIEKLIYTHGRHSMAIGADLERLQLNEITSSMSGGTYTFTSLQNLLAARPSTLEVQVPGSDTIRGTRTGIYGFYVQDDFRLRSDFTLNLGARYEFITAPTEVNGKVSTLRKQSDPQFTVGLPYFNNPSKKAIAPRVGFAWNVKGDGKTSVRGGFGLFYDQLLPFNYRTTMARTPPFYQAVSVTFLASNPPGFSSPINFAALGSSALPRLDTFPFHPNQPYMLQYNLSLQRQLTPSMVVSATYAGSHGVHLIHIAEGNQALPIVDPDGTYHFPVNAQGQPLGQRRFPQWGPTVTKPTEAESFYHSLLLSLQRRFSKGLQFQFSYAFSKSIDDGSNPVGTTDLNNESGLPPNPDANKAVDRGLSAMDQRHNFTFNLMAELPFRPSGKVANALAAGWQLSTVSRITTGTPFSVILGFDRAGALPRSGGGGQRPSLAPGASSNPVRPGNPDHYFDPSAFVLPPAGYFGNLGRNTLIGPGIINFDYSMIKNFRVTEGKSLQFRAELFNIFNHANFALPYQQLTVFSSSGRVPAAGRITDTNTKPRQIQFGLKFIF